MKPDDVFDGERGLRLKQVLMPGGPLPISRSSWLEGVRKGLYPAPIRLGKRITAWRASDIRALIERGSGHE